MKKDAPGINIHLPVFKSSTNPFERYISGRSGSMRCFLGFVGPERGLMPEASFLSLAQFPNDLLRHTFDVLGDLAVFDYRSALFGRAGTKKHTLKLE